MSRRMFSAAAVCAMTGLSLVISLVTSAAAKNVDFSTVPGRATVQLTIYNSKTVSDQNDHLRAAQRAALPIE